MAAALYPRQVETLQPPGNGEQRLSDYQAARQRLLRR
jgi:hypothetical protein